MKHFHSWYGAGEYIDGMLEIGPLIARAEDLPAELKGFVHELRQCYAFQQYLAVCVLCRTCIEIALRHICELEGFFDPESDKYSITQSYLATKAKAEGYRNRKVVDDYLAEPRDTRHLLSTIPNFKKKVSKLSELYGDLSRIVHGSLPSKKKSAREFARETIDLLHELYEI